MKVLLFGQLVVYLGLLGGLIWIAIGLYRDGKALKRVEKLLKQQIEAEFQALDVLEDKCQ